MLPALKPALLSRFTMALAVALLSGGTVHTRLNVPLLFTGDPSTVKSLAGAVIATLVTVPDPVPGKVCPAANVICPVLLILNPVSDGTAVPEPNSRFSVPEGVAVSLPVGSACHWKVWFTAFEVELLNDEATKFSSCEFLPVTAVAAPDAGSVKGPRTAAEPCTSSVTPGVAVLIPIFAVAPEPVWLMAEF